MKELIETVRKHGEVRVNSKAEALALIAAAAKLGYTFGHKIQGWSHLVKDLDN